MELSIFSKDELNFINIHVGLVIKDKTHLKDCIFEACDDAYYFSQDITFLGYYKCKRYE